MLSLIGYARVSSTHQSVTNQVKQLKAAECSDARQEKVSGQSRDGRSELATILDFARTGDNTGCCKT
jgi:DNA invertase Pin-like site-specific DNA recombinase